MMKLAIICPRLLSSGLTDGRPLVLVQESDARLWHLGNFIACARPMPYYCAAGGCVPACASGCNLFCASKFSEAWTAAAAAAEEELLGKGACRSCCGCCWGDCCFVAFTLFVWHYLKEEWMKIRCCVFAALSARNQKTDVSGGMICCCTNRT